MITRTSGKHGAPCYATVTVCDEWRNDPRVFGAWALANGFEPGLTIDRKDAKKGYEPDNCRWITRAKNTSLSHVSSPRPHGPDGKFVGAATT